MIRRLLMILLCLVLLAAPVCTYAEGDDTAENAETTEAADTAETADTAEEDISVHFAVFFTADTNGQLKGDQTHIGYSRLVGLYELQDEAANVLLLDAGNALGTEDPDKVIKVMRAAGYTAMGIGVKDAALGIQKLQELDAKGEFPLLCANWLRADGELYYQPYTIVEVDGLVIGIIGLISPDIKEMYPELTENDNVYDPVPIANIYYEEMEEAGCDCYIALTSLGFEGDYTPLYLGANCPWLDMILDSNTAEEDILDNGTLVDGTDTAVFNLASDFTSMSVIETTAGHYGYQGLYPSTMSAADFSEITRTQRIEDLINTDFSVIAEDDGAESGNEEATVTVHKTLSSAQKFVLLTVLIAGITIVIIVLVFRKKEKK